MASIAESIERAVRWDSAEHYLNAPSHGAAELRLVAAISGSTLTDLSDDPAIAAYQLRDILPELYAHIHAINRWAYAVIEAQPDDIPESGARL